MSGVACLPSAKSGYCSAGEAGERPIATDARGRPAPTAAPVRRSPRRLLARALRRAWWAILWERLWPALAALAIAIGLFLAVSWAGLWLWLPPMGRAIALFVLLVLVGDRGGAAAALPPAEHLRRPAPARSRQRPRAPAGDRASPTSWRPRESDPGLAGAVARPCRAGAARRASAARPARRVRACACCDPIAVRALVLLLVVRDVLRCRRRAHAAHRRGVRLGRRGAGRRISASMPG